MIGNRTAKKSLGFSLQPTEHSVGRQSKMKMMEEKHKREDELLRVVEAQDLHKFGLIPEFVGRLQVLVSINNLTEADFVRILTEPDNAIVKQCRAQLAPVELQITDDALARIAQLAIERGTGARGLNSTMHGLLRIAKYEIPGSDIEAGEHEFKIFKLQMEAWETTFIYSYRVSDYWQGSGGGQERRDLRSQRGTPNRRPCLIQADCLNNNKNSSQFLHCNNWSHIFS